MFVHTVAPIPILVHSFGVATASYADVIVRNVRAERARRGLEQRDLVERMRALGLANWHRQTLSRVERGERRLLAEEVMALAIALETTVSELMVPHDDDAQIVFPSGVKVAGMRLLSNDRSVTWDEKNAPVVSPPRPLDNARLAAEGAQKMLERTVGKMLDEGDPRLTRLVEAVLARHAGGT